MSSETNGSNARHGGNKERDDQTNEIQSQSKPIPITKERLEESLASARIWSNELPNYASFQQSKADWWAIAAGIVAAIAGLAIFPAIDADSNNTTKLIVSIPAFLAALFALVPRVKNYSEMASQGREIASLYGPLTGRLIDSVAAMEAENPSANESISAVIRDFEAAKAKKDQLRYLPDRSKARKRLEESGKI